MDEVKEKALNWLATKLGSASFTFAKTMEKIPHSYTLRKDWNDGEFRLAVSLIRQYGVDEAFYSKTFTYLYLNGYKYWTMGEPIDLMGKPHTYIINRAKVEYDSPYNQIAGDYDDLFKDDYHEDENKRVIDIIDYRGGSVLDVGAGTGLFLDYVKPDEYLGIDRSAGMLAELKDKHPDANVINTSFEDFYTDRTFDYIVMMFGVGSHMSEETERRILRRLNPGGKAVVMYYKEGYYPETYVRTGIEEDYRLSKRVTTTYNEFDIYVEEKDV